MDQSEGPFAGLTGNHVCIRVPDFEAGRRWWIETFDFEFVREWTYEGMRLCYVRPRNDPHTQIEIVGDGRIDPDQRTRAANLADSLRPPGFHHYAFHVDDIVAATAALRERGVRFLEEPWQFGPLNVWITFFYDPWGNIFELVERPKP